jgi:hypothetical protein
MFRFLTPARNPLDDQSCHLHHTRDGNPGFAQSIVLGLGGQIA